MESNLRAPFFLDRRVLPDGRSSWVRGKSGWSFLSVSEVRVKKAGRQEEKEKRKKKGLEEKER